MNLKIEKVPVVLNGVVRNLVFDLNAHYELSKKYITLQKLVDEIQRKSVDSVPEILQCGFAHEEEIPLIELGLLVDVSNIDYLTLQTIQALMYSLPDSNKFTENQIPKPTTDEDTGWDWDWLYYMGTVLLNMSEAVFWRSSPRKLFALWAVHKKYNGLETGNDQEVSRATEAWLDQYI
ncbi:hypothetical protein ACM1RC_26595 [Paenibacillus azoreducens]|uniref:hypothetical protein n=1 Tax=Paenibacillus azoreducens TaxID=116718 RepID=UPI0039F4B3E6